MATAGILGIAGAGPPAYSRIVSSSGLVTTTSVTAVLIPGLSITPPAGTYLVMVRADARNTNNANSVTVSIFSGGVLVPNTDTQQGNNVFGSLITTARVTVNGAQAIDGRWLVSGATGEMTSRALHLVNVENN